MSTELKLLPLFVIIPVVGMLLVILLRRVEKYLRDVIANAFLFALVVHACLVLAKLIASPGMAFSYKVGGWAAPIGISMTVDMLSGVMLVLVNVVAFLSGLYAVSYMKKYRGKTSFFVLLQLMVAGLNGVLLAGDVFNMYVFLEITSIASYSLVAFGVRHEELEASFKYLVQGAIGAMLMLFSVGMLYAMTGTLSFEGIRAAIAGDNGAHANLIGFIAVTLIVGFGIKSALVPFHSWLPYAHSSAPAPVSAMLSGVLIKTLGVYAMTRVVLTVLAVPVQGVLLGLGIASMIVGILLSLYQWDFKRLLAYSSVSHMGFIMLGLGLGTPLGILGAVFHVVNHSMTKSLLFLASGAVEFVTGKRDLRELAGLSKYMPVTSASVLVGSMSISGIPPFAGFWSKLVIVIACVQAGNLWAAVVAVLVSVVTMMAYGKALRHAFYGDVPAEPGVKSPAEAATAEHPLKEAPVAMLVPMVILILACVAAGLMLVPQAMAAVLDPVVRIVQGVVGQ